MQLSMSHLRRIVRDCFLAEGRVTKTEFSDLTDDELDSLRDQLEDELTGAESGPYEEEHSIRKRQDMAEYEVTIRRARAKAGEKPAPTGVPEDDYRALISWIDSAYQNFDDYAEEVNLLHTAARQVRDQQQGARYKAAAEEERKRLAGMSPEAREAELAQRAVWAVYGGDPSKKDRGLGT